MSDIAEKKKDAKNQHINELVRVPWPWCTPRSKEEILW